MHNTEGELSLDQFRAIEWHTNQMIAAASNAIAKLRSIPVPHRTEQILNQLAYYKHAIGGYKWSLEVARQRCPRCRNVQ